MAAIEAHGDDGLAEETLGEVVIESRYNGPQASANGGYACGRLAQFLEEPAEVTLRMPPPLDRVLAVRRADGNAARMYAGDELIAEGRTAAEVDAEPPLRPTFEEAVAATALHPGRGLRHALSDCFVCSPYRGNPGDGLGISPGPVAGSDDVCAAPFVPDDSVGDLGVVRPEVIWAALDCPSYAPSIWRTGRIALLGRLRVRRERDVAVGERLVAVGWSLAAEGRKHRTASALLDSDGAIVGRGVATWIELRT